MGGLYESALLHNRKDNTMVENKSFSKRLLTYLAFMGPTLFAFITVILVPFIFGIYLTFTNWDGISSHMSLVGLQNYKVVVSDVGFWNSMALTIKYVFFSVLFVNVISFLLAYALSNGLKGQNFFRAGFFMPNLIGGIVLGFIWKFIFSSALVYMGNHMNLPFLSSSWLSDPNKAFWSLVIVTVWQYTGYMMVIYIAGFMNIPKELVEAASIDGANEFVKLKNIILPMMVPSVIICTFLTLQRGFMAYDLNLALTGGGPFKSTELVSMYVYGKAFLSQEYGIGQSEAVLLFLMVAGITFIQVYFSKKLEVEA